MVTPNLVNRQKLLEAAARVFAEAGFRGATTRRIAEEAPNATLLTVDDATHGVSNLGYKFAPWVDDWMAERLGARIT